MSIKQLNFDQCCKFIVQKVKYILIFLTFRLRFQIFDTGFHYFL